MLQQKPNKYNGFELQPYLAPNQSIEYFAQLINIRSLYFQAFPLKDTKLKLRKGEKASYKEFIKQNFNTEDLKRRNEYQNIGFRRNCVQKLNEDNELDQDNKFWYSFLIEYDDIPLDEQIPLVKSICEKENIPLPTCYVYTGNKSYHFYWVLEHLLDSKIGEEINTKLIKSVFKGCDEKFLTINQPSRLPGYKHLLTGKESVLYIWTNKRYTVDDFSHLPEIEEEEEVTEDNKTKKTKKSRELPKGFKVPTVKGDKIANTRHLIKKLDNDRTYYQLTKNEKKEAFKKAITEIANSVDGEKNDDFYRASADIGRLLVKGVNLDDAIEILNNAAEKRLKQTSGNLDKAKDTILDGLYRGVRNILRNSNEGFKRINYNLKANKKINQKYLTDDILDNLQKYKVLGIKSAIGTGKTTLIRNYIKNNPDKKILILVHRISLIDNFSIALSELGFYRYDELVNPSELKECDKLLVTVDSLHKLGNNDLLKNYDLLFVDEVDQVLTHLVSGGTEIKKNRYNTTDILRALISISKNTILASATLSNYEINFIKELCALRDKNIFSINNNYNTRNQTIRKYEDKNTILEKIHNAINSNKKIAIASNSIEEIKSLTEALNTKFPNKKIESITSENIKRQKQLITKLVNSNDDLDIDVLLYSPSLGTGFDISRVYFDDIFLVATSSKDLSAEDLMQLVGRIRNPKSNTIHAYIPNKIIGQLKIDIDEVRSNYIDLNTNICPTYFNKSGRKVNYDPQLNNAFINYLSVTEVRKNQSVQRLNNNFFKLAINNGFTIENNKITVENNSYLEELKQAKEKLKQEEITNTINAKKISSIEADKLKKDKKTKGINEDEQYQLDKFYFLEMTGIAEPTEDDIKWFRDYGNKAYPRLKTLLSDDFYLKCKDYKEQKLEGKKMVNDFKNYQKVKELLKTATDLIEKSLTTVTTKKAIFNRVFNEETLEQSGFLNWITENQKEIYNYLKFKPDIQKPVKAAARFLELIGLITEGKQIRDGDMRARWYFVTAESEQRQQRMTNKILETLESNNLRELEYELKNPNYVGCHSQNLEKYKTKIKDYVHSKTLEILTQQEF